MSEVKKNYKYIDIGAGWKREDGTTSCSLEVGRLKEMLSHIPNETNRVFVSIQENRFKQAGDRKPDIKITFRYEVEPTRAAEEESEDESTDLPF